MPAKDIKAVGAAVSSGSTAWRTFRIASAAGFLVLLDTTAVAAAYTPAGTGLLPQPQAT